jgi:phospholipid/cholesterol/gamma-HCH transport system substrate-binding protein
MENKSHALIAGLFTVALGIVLALCALWLSRDRTVRVHYELVTRTSVAGLATESAVRFRGMDVGRVEQISFDPDHIGQILVRIAVDKGTPVTRSTSAQLQAQGVTGLSYVQLDDDGSSQALLPSGTGTESQIRLEPGLFDKLSGSSEVALAQLTEVLKRVNLLLAPENRQSLVSTLTSIDRAATRAATVGEHLEPALTRLPGTLDAAREALTGIKGTVSDLDKVALRLNEQGGTLDRFTGSLNRFDAAADTLTSQTLPRFNTLSVDAAATARSLTRAARELDNQPESLIFGRETARPGPGESGYVVPR